MGIAIIILYCLCLSFILFYSLMQLYLTVLYLRRKKRIAPPLPSDFEWPQVTVQLPIYNEKYVIERLIRAVCAFDYPKNKLEIQVLDDSTDETVDIVAKLCKELQSQGFDIQHITREKNIDYKAGALDYGMTTAKGDFIAIFDADFVPEPDFLRRTVPWFQDKHVGMVQSRWGHINLNYSLITKLQAYALNAHFTIEQGGRNSKGHFINFNGTAGLWRRTTIEDAGGWEGDTLTEDLDLSYRAQLKGWRFVFMEDLVSPAELPPEMNALKSQQFRWAKGPVQVQKKVLMKMLASPDFSFGVKLGALFHLLNSFTWLCVYGSGLLLPPFLYVMSTNPDFQAFGGVFTVFHISFISLLIFYFIANRNLILKTPRDYLLYLFHYPAFITLSMGISLYNAVGVLEGYIGKKSSFVRTPKFHIVDKKDGIEGKQYVQFKFTLISVLELLSFCYFVFGVWLSVHLKQFAATPFLVMISIGFGAVFLMSYVHARRAG